MVDLTVFTSRLISKKCVYCIPHLIKLQNALSLPEFIKRIKLIQDFRACFSFFQNVKCKMPIFSQFVRITQPALAVGFLALLLSGLPFSENGVPQLCGESWLCLESAGHKLLVMQALPSIQHQQNHGKFRGLNHSQEMKLNCSSFHHGKQWAELINSS